MPDYACRSLADTWQTAGVGETSVVAMVTGRVQDLAGYLSSIGVPGDVAEVLARGGDQLSGQCLLELYRSASQEDGPASRATRASYRPFLRHCG
ncbi:MAG: hypothetical protein L0K86_05485 [Actinomycetia bacterium]|nr:hypothetical protein [Actinomycetes bacterium]